MSKEKWLQLPEKLHEQTGKLFDAYGYDLEKMLVTDRPAVPEPSDWMTRAQAAEYARKSTDTIDNWCAKGYIEKSKLGNGRPGTVLVSRSSLEKFIRSGIVKRNVHDWNSGAGK